jgi:hypothetical protein
MSKTAAQFKAEYKAKAEALPVEVKKKFYRLMFKEGKTMGDARKECGIEDVMVAAELIVQMHVKIWVPKAEKDIR